MKSKTLVPIINRSGKAIVPPPTRKEVVEALVLRLAREHEENCKKWAADIATAKQNVRNAILAALTPEMASKAFNPESINDSHDRVKITLELLFKDLPKETIKEVHELRNLYHNRPGFFDAERQRRRMREALQADPARVKALSESKEIELTLAHIKKNTPKPIKVIENGYRTISIEPK